MKSKIILFQKQLKESSLFPTTPIKSKILAIHSKIYYFQPNFELIKKSLYRYSHSFYSCPLLISHIIQCLVSGSIRVVLDTTEICVNV